MNDEAIPSNISPEIEDTLQELSTALDLYEGEFKLLLARCNYQDLRDRLIIRLKEIHPPTNSGNQVTAIAKGFIHLHHRSGSVRDSRSIGDRGYG